jgi:hypothetical protein
VFEHAVEEKLSAVLNQVRAVKDDDAGAAFFGGFDFLGALGDVGARGCGTGGGRFGGFDEGVLELGEALAVRQGEDFEPGEVELLPFRRHGDRLAEMGGEVENFPHGRSMEWLTNLGRAVLMGSMESKGSPFLKGGFGCLTFFLIFSIFLARGRVNINFLGLLTIFIVGGLIAKSLSSAYEKGRSEVKGIDEHLHEGEAASSPGPARSGEAPPMRRSVHEAVVCEHCGMTVPPGAEECSRCGWVYKG